MATFLGLDFVEQRQSGKLEILGAGVKWRRRNMH